MLPLFFLFEIKPFASEILQQIFLNDSQKGVLPGNIRMGRMVAVIFIDQIIPAF